MKKLVGGLAAAVLLAATIALVLWLQLQAERERGVELVSRNSAQPMTEMAEVLVQPVVASAPAADAGQSSAAPVAQASPRRPIPWPA